MYCKSQIDIKPLLLNKRLEFGIDIDKFLIIRTIIVAMDLSISILSQGTAIYQLGSWIRAFEGWKTDSNCRPRCEAKSVEHGLPGGSILWISGVTTFMFK